MGLVVQHNLTAMNANRQLGVITGAQAKATEKLSSGYRINRAGDDAAGLTISEKMRSQIRGLDRASTNAQDGISLIQSAEGALNEAHSILQRMNELAVQGANDTNQEIDRDAINKELVALTDELDRISTTTQFNKQNLLDGSFKGKKLQVGANTNQYISITIGNMNAETLGLGKDKTSITRKSTVTTSYQTSIAGSKFENYTYNNLTYSTKNSLRDAYAANIVATSKYMENMIKYAASLGSAKTFYSVATLTANLSAAIACAKALGSTAALSYISNMTGQSMVSQKFATVTKWSQQTKISTVTKDVFARMSTRYGARVDNYAAANNTISKVQAAINKISEQRSALGALQNRLEHTVANLDTVSENTSAAESRIRDTDMASTMVEYSKNNILAQAGQSMLAQANQSTQGVLSLLG